MQKIKKGDKVVIISGKDKGKEGAVNRILWSSGKVFVEGAGQYKRHSKVATGGRRAGIIPITKPLDVSSVMLICPSCKKPTRVGFKLEKDKKLRFCKKCGENVK